MWQVVAVAAIAAAVAGCGSSSAPTPVKPDPRLVARADLDPCPPSAAAPVAGGLPDVTLPCLGRGASVRLAGLRGRPLLLNIWGSWCGPCQKEARYLAEAYAELKPRVRFVGVDDEDDPDSALDFAAHVTPRMRYPSVVDEDKKVLVALHVPTAVPMTVFVGADGRIAHVRPQAYRSTADVLRDVASYLGVTA